MSKSVADILPDEDVNTVDLMHFLEGIVRMRGVAGHHITSMNDLVMDGIRAIIERGFSIKQTIINKRADNAAASSDSSSGGITDIQYYLKFNQVKISKPVFESGSLRATNVEVGRRTSLDATSASALGIMLPAFARERMLSYLMNVHVNAEIVATAYYANKTHRERRQTINDLPIGQIPAMVRSASCHLDGMSRDDLIALQEDPNEIGGYFIIRGGEHSVDCTENPTINDIRLTLGRHKTEMARAQIWSKSGDGFNNSYQCTIRRLMNGSITIETQIFSIKQYQIPFIIVLRLLTGATDRQIAQSIIGDTKATDPITQSLVSLLNDAFLADYDAQWMPLIAETNNEYIGTILAKRILDITGNTLAEHDSNVERRAYNLLMAQFDERILSHLGILPIDRAKKARYLGLVIRKLFLTILGLITPLDRDSLATKRIQPAGISMSKAFKTTFSIAVTSPIRRALASMFEGAAFDAVNMESAIRNAIKRDALSSKIMKMITVGNSDVQIGRRVITNRVSSQLRYLRADINGHSIANNVSITHASSNNQTERAEQQRRVQSTHIGYFDVTQSVDTGNKVGMNKQLAVSAIISSSIPSDPLKATILDAEGANIVHLDDGIMERMVNEKLSAIFVNGDWIGCIARDWEFVARWRAYRRAGPESGSPMIHRHTSIYWNPTTRDVQFWTDSCRLLRPLIIVYNNLDKFNEGKADEFTQWATISRAVIGQFLRGEVDMEWLQREGIIEYISADESDNVFIAPNINNLHDARHDLSRPYTHCDIEQAIHGIVTLSSPLMNHAYGIRTTYYNNQRKQSCGWPSLAFPYRTDKKVMLQYYCDHPLVETFADRLVNPNGQNCIVALMIHGGYNQEDSVIVNAGSVQRGLFNGSFFDYETSMREHGETFDHMDSRQVDDRQVGANEDNLVDGVVRVGTLLTRNCVMIHKVAVVTQDPSARRSPNSITRYIDRSTVYTKRTPAIVTKIVRGENDQHVPFIRVVYRQLKDVIRGDKLSSRSGNKGIVARLIPDCDMPYTEDGVRPDVVVNAQSIPTRRALNQIIETLLGTYAAREGCHIDATVSMPIDVNAVMDTLKARGFHDAGYSRMYNGITGDMLDLPIFIGPTCYHRLSKFVDGECRALRRGPVDFVTHQPIRGGVDHGALRIGEMEIWSLICHGAQRSFTEKIKHDSDGTVVHICSRCGNHAIFNSTERIYNCRTCGQYARIVEMPTTWTSNMMMEGLRALGVQTHIEVDPIPFFTSPQ
jgi:DNA-directed RNA polymerase beta subunit